MKTDEHDTRKSRIETAMIDRANDEAQIVGLGKSFYEAINPPWVNLPDDMQVFCVERAKEWRRIVLAQEEHYLKERLAKIREIIDSAATRGLVRSAYGNVFTQITPDELQRIARLCEV